MSLYDPVGTSRTPSTYHPAPSGRALGGLQGRRGSQARSLRQGPVSQGRRVSERPVAYRPLRCTSPSPVSPSDLCRGRTEVEGH